MLVFVTFFTHDAFASLISTSWCRHVGVCLDELLGSVAVITLINNISLVLRLFILSNFRDLIYAQSSCNTPKRKQNLKSSYDPFNALFSALVYICVCVCMCICTYCNNFTMLQFLLYFVLNKCSLSKTKVQNINNKCGVWKIALLMMYSHMKYSSVGAAVIVPVDFI